MTAPSSGRRRAEKNAAAGDRPARAGQMPAPISRYLGHDVAWGASPEAIAGTLWGGASSPENYRLRWGRWRKVQSYPPAFLKRHPRPDENPFSPRVDQWDAVRRCGGPDLRGMALGSEQNAVRAPGALAGDVLAGNVDSAAASVSGAGTIHVADPGDLSVEGAGVVRAGTRVCHERHCGVRDGQARRDRRLRAPLSAHRTGASSALLGPARA